MQERDLHLLLKYSLLDLTLASISDEISKLRSNQANKLQVLIAERQLLVSVCHLNDTNDLSLVVYHRHD